MATMKKMEVSEEEMAAILEARKIRSKGKGAAHAEPEPKMDMKATTNRPPTRQAAKNAHKASEPARQVRTATRRDEEPADIVFSDEIDKQIVEAQPTRTNRTRNQVVEETPEEAAARKRSERSRKAAETRARNKAATEGETSTTANKPARTKNEAEQTKPEKPKSLFQRLLAIGNSTAIEFGTKKND